MRTIPPNECSFERIGIGLIVGNLVVAKHATGSVENIMVEPPTLSRIKQRQQLRMDMRKVLANLDRRWLDAACREVSDALGDLIDHRIRGDKQHLLAWIPHFPGEVDLSRLITEKLSKYSIYVPCLESDERMEFCSIGEDWTQMLRVSGGGIPEPVDGVSYDASDAASTIVLVPGLVFDSFGNRLGRGKGYYDKFLARAGMAEAIKVGVCWSLQLSEEFPVESHDVGMDWVVHERGIIQVSESIRLEMAQTESQRGGSGHSEDLSTGAIYPSVGRPGLKK